MIAALLLALPTAGLVAPPSAALPPQEQQPGQEPAKPDQPVKKAPEKRAFPKLKSTEIKQLGESLYQLRAAKLEETALAAGELVVAFGAGAVPACLADFGKFEGERLALLTGVLDRVLVDADLDLAWREVGKKTPAATRNYLVRRIADSTREDAAKLLVERLNEASEGSREAYEAGRGLAWRGDRSGLPAVLRGVADDWTEGRERLRRDFAGIERRPLSAPAAELVKGAPDRAGRLAALHLFELVGAPAQLVSLKPALADPDNMVKLAAVNACRVANGEEPVDTASVMQIIELSRAWEERL